MPIQRLRLHQLPPEERADLESAMKDERSRYEDRQIYVMLLVLAAAWLMVLGLFLMYEARKWYGREGDPLQSFEGFFRALPESLPLLWQAELLEFAGLVAVPVLMVALVVHAWRTHKAWNGYALTSSAFVRIRGDSLRVLRYKHISEVRLRKKSETLYGRNYMRLEAFDEEGRSLVAVGYGYEDWKDLLEARRSVPRSIDDPDKRSP